MKRLRVINCENELSFFVYAEISIEDLNDPLKALHMLRDLIPCEWFDVYFGREFVTSSEM
jgi:hypothetical protein